MAKPARTIEEQVNLLKSRGMLFRDESKASHFLQNISYYRLKGYWWDMQDDRVNHSFSADSYFEDVIERYSFDRHLRLILFDAVERIEIALRTKMIYHLSHTFGATWYKDASIFTDVQKHGNNLSHLTRDFGISREIFVNDHKNRYPNTDPESWKVMEIVSMGTLSKFYKNLNHQLPEKSMIAKEMGLQLSSELSSWLEAIVYIRNIIAHHSRLWSRNMVKRPIDGINNPMGAWFTDPLLSVQKKKPFLIISSLIYLCNVAAPDHRIKSKVLTLISDNPKVPIYKLGFLNNWENQPIWQ